VIISYGAGVGSTALVVLMVQDGWRGEVVHADTGCEWPETVAYRAIMDDWLARYGLSIKVLDGEWRKEKKARDKTLYEYCLYYGILPFPFPRFCTAKYKTAPMVNYADGRVQALGISIDERHRAHNPNYIYPLVDREIMRNPSNMRPGLSCIEIIRDAGLPIPIRSKCWLCPFQTEREWHQLWRDHRDLYEKASTLERYVQEHKAKKRGRWMSTLDPGGKVTLAERATGYKAQMPLVFGGTPCQS